MKQTDYEWMLFGCHPVSDVAMAYCSCEHTTSSTRAFRKLVKLYPRLYEALCRYGYTERTICGQGKGHTAMRRERNCAADWHSPSSTSLDAVSSFSLMNATQPLTSPSVMTGTAVTRR